MIILWSKPSVCGGMPIASRQLESIQVLLSKSKPSDAASAQVYVLVPNVARLCQLLGEKSLGMVARGVDVAARLQSVETHHRHGNVLLARFALAE